MGYFDQYLRSIVVSLTTKHKKLEILYEFAFIWERVNEDEWISYSDRRIMYPEMFYVATPLISGIIFILIWILLEIPFSVSTFHGLYTF